MKRIFTSLFLTVLLAVTGSVWALEQVDGVYQIGTAKDFVAFAAVVNGGEYTAKAVLTADINMDGADMSNFPIGVGNSAKSYKGVFDGQGHKFSNLVLNRPDAANNFGVFNTGAGVVLMNFWLDSSCAITGKELVGLIGRHDGAGTFENVGNCGSVAGQGNNVGGLIGGIWGAGSGTSTPTTFTNCWTTGAITTSDSHSKKTDCGCITGWFNNGLFVLDNCWTIATLNNKTNTDQYVFRNGAGAKFTYNNCYALNGTQPNFTKFEGISASDLATGAIAFQLNGDQSSIVWYQTLGVDGTPVPFGTHGVVYYNGRQHCDGSAYTDGVYENENKGITIDDHVFTDGICTECGKPSANYMEPTDDYYVIENELQLAWFAAMVDDGNAAINGKLKNDIALTKAWTKPIGVVDAPFSGKFDGQGFAITGFDMAASTDRSGFFGYLSKATVANFSIAGTLTVSAGSGAGVVGYTSSSTIQNIHSSLTVSVPVASVHHVGGVVGSAQSNNVIDGCSFSGAMTVADGSTDCFGGVVGYIRTSEMIRNCANYGTVTFDAATCYAGGVVGYLNQTSSNVENCLNVGTVEFNGDTPTYGGAIIGRLNSFTQEKLLNNFWLTGSGIAATGGKTEANSVAVSAAKLSSGEVAYLLGSAFRQTIGTDAAPVFDTTHGIVNKIGAAGYATQYIADTDVTIPAGVKAYTGKVNGDYLTLTEVTEKIPAAAAVVLEGAEGYYSFVPTTGADAVAENDLIGVTKKTAADGSQYVLAKKDDVVGFYQATEGTIAAGKAYLTGIAAGVKVVTFGTATSLTPALSEENAPAVIYDLSGRRVEKATKGIYIVNGKTILK